MCDLTAESFKKCIIQVMPHMYVHVPVLLIRTRMRKQLKMLASVRYVLTVYVNGL